MKQMRLDLEDDLHTLLCKEQQHRLSLGLPKLSLHKLAKVLMLEAMMTRHMAEQEERRHASNRG